MKKSHDGFYIFFSIYFLIANLLCATTVLNICTQYIRNFRPNHTTEIAIVVLLTVLFAFFFYSFITGIALTWKRKLKQKRFKIVSITQIVLWAIGTVTTAIGACYLSTIFANQELTGLSIATAAIALSIAACIVSIFNLIINILGLKKFLKKEYPNILKN